MKRIEPMVVAFLLLGMSSPGAADLTMKVLRFDGGDDVVELPGGAFAGLEEVTVEAWVQWEKFNKDSSIFYFGQKGNSIRVHNDKSDRHLKFSFQDSEGKKHDVRIKKGLKLGTWHHIAVICGGDKMALMIDGEKRETDNYKGGFEQLAEGGRYLLGAAPGSKAEPFQGAMTEVRVWNKRLTREEINARKDRLLTGPEEGLVAYWRLNEIVGGAAENSVGGGQSGAVTGAEVMDGPAIARFLVPGELEKEAEVHYVAGTQAMAAKEYAAAVEAYQEALTYVFGFKDAPALIDESMRLENMRVADLLYAEANTHLADGAFIEAFRDFDSALERVPQFRDAEALRANSLDNGSYRVAFSLFRPFPSVEAKPADDGVIKKLGKAMADDRVDKSDRNALREDLYQGVATGLLDSLPPYVNIVDQTSFLAQMSTEGPDFKVTGAQALQVAREAGIPVVVMGRFTKLYVSDSDDDDEKTAYTTKQEKYTNKEGKKKKRKVAKKVYTYHERTKSRTANAAFQYQFIDTATGNVLQTGTVEKSPSDNVFYVNWNNFKGVSPSKLHKRKKNGKYEKLDTSHFDTRMSLQSESELYGKAIDRIVAEIVAAGTTCLTDYRPGGQGAAQAPQSDDVE